MRRFVIIMLAVSLVIGGVIAYFASPDPDGLERVAEDKGFAEQAKDPSLEVMPDYTMPGVGGFASSFLAGVIGVLATFGVVYVGMRLTSRKKP